MAPSWYSPKMGAIIFGLPSHLCSPSGAPVQTGVALSILPEVSRRGTPSFPVFLHLRRLLRTSDFSYSYFNYSSHSPVTSWHKRMHCLDSLRNHFSTGRSQILSLLQRLFLFLIFASSLSLEIRFPLFFSNSVSYKPFSYVTILGFTEQSTPSSTSDKKHRPATLPTLKTITEYLYETCPIEKDQAYLLTHSPLEELLN